jgi:hypothetical protein
MKWLMAVMLPFCVPSADVLAQEVKSDVSAAVPLSAFPVPQPRPETQGNPHDAVKGTWTIGFDLASVQFGSSLFHSTTLGVNTNVDYYLREHVAVEGRVTSTYEVHSTRDSDGRYVFYGGGMKLSTGNRRLQPFALALAGGVHMYPQTAFSANGFAAQAGGGVEKKLREQLWLRIEGDYVRSWLYKSGQNNFQGLVGIHWRL